MGHRLSLFKSSLKTSRKIGRGFHHCSINIPSGNDAVFLKNAFLVQLLELNNRTVSLLNLDLWQRQINWMSLQYVSSKFIQTLWEKASILSFQRISLVLTVCWWVEFYLNLGFFKIFFVFFLKQFYYLFAITWLLHFENFFIFLKRNQMKCRNHFQTVSSLLTFTWSYVLFKFFQRYTHTLNHCRIWSYFRPVIGSQKLKSTLWINPE